MSDGTPATTPAGAPTSTIHDLGYRRYEGAREGARGAFRALVWHGVRTMFAFGRPLKAKAVPAVAFALSILPGLAAVVASGASGGQLPVQYGAFIGPQFVMAMLFAAAQTPEVMSRDQQHRVLPLLFTRDLTRTRYAMARLLSTYTALFIVALVPLLVLWLGEISVAPDPGAAFAKNGPRIGPVLLMATTSTWVISTISTALASLTSRRAYATAAIIGYFLVTAAVTAGLSDLADVPGAVTELLDPLRGLSTMGMLLFGETTRGMELQPPPPLPVFIVVFGVMGAVATGLLFWRTRRVSA